MRYVALVHKDKDSSYGISFPDFPGCISAGNTVDEAVTNAVEALAFHVQGLEADGITAPSPRSIEAIRNDKSLRTVLPDATFAYVPLVQDRGSARRINVSLDPGLIEAIDEAAKDRGMTRSAFLSSAARRELAEG
ncbi:type II toxin-antitoxin system HicB family antitoxin [Taklimakanibacter lacteus]|uniref:type II toxin-antitoxin system HicB family antitoxin n=1 Tax=Taklimakanibacter lacteus TaxID=2268456 RepID=UPI000E66DE20